MKLSISFTDSVCFHSFCGTFRCRPLPMQYFMAKKKRRDAISCASHEFHWTFMLTYWTVTTQHSVHLISFKRRWKEKCMQKNLRIELLIFSRRPVGMNENDVNWSTFFALFFFCYLNISSMSNMSTLTNFTRIVLVCFLFVVRGSKIFNCFAVFLLSILIWMRSRKITVWIIDIPPLIRIFRSINSSLSDTMNDKAAHKNLFRAKSYRIHSELIQWQNDIQMSTTAYNSIQFELITIFWLKRDSQL